MSTTRSEGQRRTSVNQSMDETYTAWFNFDDGVADEEFPIPKSPIEVRSISY